MPAIRPDRPLDADLAAIISALNEAADATGLPCMIVGATARDLLMTHVFGIPASRLTRDIDFAFAIGDWAQFETLKTALLALGRFDADDRAPHRLRYWPPSMITHYPVDLIPCGGIEDSNHYISWPPDLAVVMNVAGYTDALRAAIQVTIHEGLATNVVSIPGLAALKVIAWADRGLQTTRDAADLLFLIKNYHAAGNADALYEMNDLMESCGYDIQRAGAELLGRDSRAVLANETLKLVTNVFDDSKLRDRLLIHLDRRDPASADQLLERYERGLRWTGRCPA